MASHSMRPNARDFRMCAELGKSVQRRVAEDKSSMIDTIRQLVEMESPSSDKKAVDRLGAHVKAEFERIGGKVTIHSAKHFGDHLQVDFPGERNGPPVLLIGHLDTVYDLGTVEFMPFRKDKERLWGPGVYDMKTGIAMMLFAISRLRDANEGQLPQPVRAFLVTDEEVSSESSRSITERLARESKAVLVLEPSQGLEGALKTARKGVGDYVVKVQGAAAHSGVDFLKGQSAILELAHQIERIAEFTELKRGLTVNPGVVRGGTRTNVVAAEAEVEVDVRIATMKDAARIEKKFRGLKPVNRKCRIEVSGGINRPAMERTEKTEQLFHTAQMLARALGFRVKEKATGGGSDGNFTAAVGAPTLDGLGAVGEGAHAPHESVFIKDLAPRTALLAGLLAAL